jgi:hypothetical protein
LKLVCLYIRGRCFPRYPENLGDRFGGKAPAEKVYREGREQEPYESTPDAEGFIACEGIRNGETGDKAQNGGEEDRKGLE